MIRKYVFVPLAEFLSRRPGVALVLAALYLASPWDLVPEAFAGPFGYVDDLFVLAAAFWVARRLRRKQSPAGPTIIDVEAEVVKRERRP